MAAPRETGALGFAGRRRREVVCVSGARAAAAQRDSAAQRGSSAWQCPANVAPHRGVVVLLLVGVPPPRVHRHVPPLLHGQAWEAAGAAEQAWEGARDAHAVGTQQKHCSLHATQLH